MVDLIVYSVRDVPQAKAFYRTLLGVEPYAGAPYYVGFRVGEQEIGPDPNGHKHGLTGPLAYWQVSDIRKALKALVDAGAQTQQDVKDVGGGAHRGSKTGTATLTGLLQSPQ